MTTLARLTLWHEPAAHDALLDAVDECLVPILARHGLTDAAPCPRAAIPGLLNHLYPFDTPDAVRDAARALGGDPDWQAQMARLGPLCGPTESTSESPAPLRWALGLYTAPAGPGRAVPAGAGIRRGPWHSFGLPDGLLSPVVNQLHQDRDGHVWMTTDDGVSCFDGSQFRHWTAADGLPHATISALGEDSAGHLWFASHGFFDFARYGLCRYDGETFEHFTVADGLPSDAVTAVLCTSDGGFWVFTSQGPAVFHGDHFEVPPIAHGPIPRSPYGAYEDPNGQIWVCTGKGLCAYHDDRFEWFPREQGGPDERIWACLTDRQGRFWVGSPNGVDIRQPDGTFSRRPVEHLLGTAGASPLQEGPDGSIWLSAFPAGVLRLSDSGEAAFTMADGLPGNRASACLIDRDGQLWVAFNGGGITLYDGDRMTHVSKRDGLLHDGCAFIRRDRHGHLWVGTDNGVNRYDGSQWLPELPAEDWRPAFIDLLEEPDGTLWGVTHGGQVQRCVAGDWQESLARPPASFNTGVFARDWDGGIWCGNGVQGVNRYHADRWTTFTAAEHGVPPGLVRALAVDPQRQRAWLGTTLGAVGYWDGTDFVAAFNGSDWDSRCILHLFVDREGRLWIGTEGAGVACYDGADLRLYTTADGLGGDRVLHVGQNRQGHLVFCTQGGGVTFFDGEVLQTLSARDGLASDVVKDFLQDEDGAYWFATHHGVTHYRPSERGPQVRLTEIIADQAYQPPFPRGMGPSDYGASLPPVTTPPEPLAVPVSQTFLRCTFQGSSYTTCSDGFAYRYRLVGHDPDWRVTREREVTYGHLPLGIYVLEVEAVDVDLQRSQADTVAIEIVPDPRDEALAEALGRATPSGDLVGTSHAALQLLQQLRQVAPTDATVLLTGETGTGKGLAARCLHGLSQRRDATFVPVNCGAITLSLIESELFGHERGAFTGAHARKLGKVELAAGGTLFLDEIGEMGPDAQVRLLRLLEEKTYERVGGTTTLTADVRVVAATNQDLQQLVEEGTFRRDLYFRLNVFPIHIPALRTRRQDIDLLATHFLAAVTGPRQQAPLSLTPAAATALRDHRWPGNIRELRNVIERATIVCQGRPIEPEDLLLPPAETRGRRTAARRDTPRQSLVEHEREYLLQVLEEVDWVIAGPKGAAKALGMAESTLRGRMATLGIKRPKRR
jgi:DNA-binding NtrC family response regulator/ligand-binding sensor domain-containing protein